MTALIRNRVTVTVGLLLTLSLVGCSDSGGKKQKIRRVEGVAKVIDLENNYVSMTVKTDRGDEYELAGTIRENTEVLINGRSHRLADLKSGDKVVVIGYREGSGETKKLVATRVEVTRPREADWKTTGKAASGKPAPTAQKPKQPSKASASAKPPVVKPPAATPKESPPTPAEEEARREQATDMVYALIRVQMEQAIEKRASLLKAGKDPSDPEVRKLEGVIMNARGYLIEAGEVVEELDPPIVQAPSNKAEQPKKDATGQVPPKKEQPKGSGPGG